MSNIIYLVAGSRSIGAGAITDNGGLYANVGMTSGRSPYERLSDPDYRKKQLGGSPVVLAEWHVGSITDHNIHKYLKMHQDVKWDRLNANTEEYLFVNDTGNGEEAKRIIEDIIISHLVPTFVTEKYLDTKLAYEDALAEAESERTKRQDIENSDPQLILKAAIADLQKKDEDRQADHIKIVDENINALIEEYSEKTELHQKEMRNKTRLANRRATLAVTLSIVCFFGLFTDTANTYLDHNLSTYIDNFKTSEIDVVKHKAELTKLQRQYNSVKYELDAYKQREVKTAANAPTQDTQKDHRKICMMASNCTYDNHNDNKLTCSVYKGADRYSCTYTVEGRIEWDPMNYCGDNKISLYNGQLHMCGMFSYKIAEFKAN